MLPALTVTRVESEAPVVLAGGEGVTWAPGYGAVELVGPCDHDCEHRLLAVVAWGPGGEHAQMVVCREGDPTLHHPTAPTAGSLPVDRCAGRCRAWIGLQPQPDGSLTWRTSRWWLALQDGTERS